MLKLDKKEEIILQTEQADKILQAVFQKADVEPNSTPLYVLTAYSTYRKDRFALQRTILVIIMTLFVLLPLLFLSPELTVTTVETEGYTATPVYTIEVDHIMPVTRITAMIDGRSIPVYEVDMHTYSVQPTTNGTMEISVTLINYQQDTEIIKITNVDTVPPVLLNSDTDHKHLHLVFSDDGSGVNFDSVYATDSHGLTIQPDSINEDTHRVSFPYPKDTINVFVEDHAGNMLQLVVSFKQ